MKARPKMNKGTDKNNNDSGQINRPTNRLTNKQTHSREVFNSLLTISVGENSVTNEQPPQVRALWRRYVCAIRYYLQWYRMAMAWYLAVIRTEYALCDLLLLDMLCDIALCSSATIFIKPVRRVLLLLVLVVVHFSLLSIFLLLPD